LIVVVAVDELLPGLGSIPKLLTVAVFEMDDPALEVTLTPSINVNEFGKMVPGAASMFNMQETVPGLPTGGVVQTRAGLGVESEANVVPAGRVSLNVMPVAGFGPLFEIVIL